MDRVPYKKWTMVKVGIDNGVSGTISIFDGDSLLLFKPIPTTKVLNYTKKVGYITRIDVEELKSTILSLVGGLRIDVVNIERPMVNPGRFKASVSAIRALEATCIALEQLGLGYKFVDSKEWQKRYLPSGIKGAPKLKEASMLKGIQLYPQFEESIKKHGDADSIFIALID